MEKTSGVLTRDEIEELLQGNPPLLEHMPDRQNQIQPNGVDLTVREIAVLNTSGAITVDNQGRVLSVTSPLAFNGLGRLDLLPGPYLVTCNEVIHVPKNITALAQPRSSLLRCGVGIHNAVWDAGYSGRSQALMMVYNPLGFRIYRNARFLQLIFFRLSSEIDRGYSGIFQGENIH
jgi:dUTP pyrophosphatase